MTPTTAEYSSDEVFFRRTMRLALPLAAAYSLLGLWWGLPNGNTTWAADSIAPMTPLAVAYHSILEQGFDSGYFYFKYPVGHQYLLALLALPTTVVAYLSGHLHGISTEYPFGFEHPEAYLTALEISYRLLSAGMACAIVALLAATARRLAGPLVGGFTALLALGCYPFVFYAHTSNVEIPFMFWAVTGLYALVRASDDNRVRWYLLLGLSAAMGISTKEQIGGFFLLMPPAIVLRHWLDHRPRRPAQLLPHGAAVGAVVAVFIYFFVNGGLWNPSGIVHRWRFLTHTLDPALRSAYAPYEFPVDTSTNWALQDELAHAAEAAGVILASYGPVVVALALIGILLLAAGERRLLFYLAVPALGYYGSSVRILKQVEIRYLLPISLLLAIPAAAALARAWCGPRWLRAGTLIVVLSGLFYSGEVLAMLLGDSRYRCEQWMQPRLEAGRRVEVYQSWTYLPRWRRTPGVSKPALEEVSVSGLRRRAPDYIVLSSKAREGITMVPNPDWRDGRGMMLEVPERRDFLERLEAESLGYRRVATFERRSWLPRLLITSLDPAMVVYEQDNQSSGVR